MYLYNDNSYALKLLRKEINMPIRVLKLSEQTSEGLLIDLYWRDLKEETQAAITELFDREEFAKDNNWDIFPIATLIIKK